jgi:hypothetical protein
MYAIHNPRPMVTTGSCCTDDIVQEQTCEPKIVTLHISDCNFPERKMAKYGNTLGQSGHMECIDPMVPELLREITP